MAVLLLYLNVLADLAVAVLDPRVLNPRVLIALLQGSIGHSRSLRVLLHGVSIALLHGSIWHSRSLRAHCLGVHRPGVHRLLDARRQHAAECCRKNGATSHSLLIFDLQVYEVVLVPGVLSDPFYTLLHDSTA